MEQIVKTSIKIKAVFKGENNSYGYKVGEEYILKVRQPSEVECKKVTIELADRQEKNYHEYENIVLFLRSWDIVKVF